MFIILYNFAACPPSCLSVPFSFIDVARRHQWLYVKARLHLTAPMDFWGNSTPFLMWQLSVQQRLAILEDDFKNEKDPCPLGTIFKIESSFPACIPILMCF